MDSLEVSREIGKTMLRYKTGLISLEQAKLELALQMAILKALEQTVIEEKISQLEAVLEGRR